MNKLTLPILRLLSDGKFHSGEVLAKQFDVTRVTIWNAVQHAESLGVQVFSIRGRGYKLPNNINFLDKDAVLKAVGEQRNWFKLEILDEIDSTNNYLLQQTSNGAAHVTCVAAQVQSNGRGRRGRTWVSSIGASLTFSLLWRFQCAAAALSGLSLAVGVALIRSLKEVGVLNAQLKWPNDVLVDNKKLAGILIDLQSDLDGPCAAVIGVGVNLNLPQLIIDNIDQPAIDVSRATKNRVDQSQLLGISLKHLVAVLSEFENYGFLAVRDEWLQNHAYQNQSVRMLMPDGRDVQGVVKSVAEDGILLVETALGSQRFSAGEISLRRSN